jgi:hypothetical protein
MRNKADMRNGRPMGFGLAQGTRWETDSTAVTSAAAAALSQGTRKSGRRPLALGPIRRKGTRVFVFEAYAAWLIIHRPSAPNSAPDPVASNATQITRGRLRAFPYARSRLSLWTSHPTATRVPWRHLGHQVQWLSRSASLRRPPGVADERHLGRELSLRSSGK